MFTNVDAKCHPRRKNKAVFLCNTFRWLNKSEFIQFLRPHTSEGSFISMQDDVINVYHRLPLLLNRDVMVAALTATSVLFSKITIYW